MKASIKSSIVACAVSAALAAPAVQATNGYFLIGIGAKNRSMGGAGIAYGQDGLAAATNPASMGMLDTNRIDAGIELFNPQRDSTLNAAAMGGGTSSEDSGATLFAIPNFGGAMKLGDMTVGLTMTGAGGMNTRYNSNIYANAFGPAIPNFAAALSVATPTFPNTGTLGVNLAQMIIAPSVSTEVADGHTLGASLLLGYQTFRAYGLGLFQGLSTNPMNVTNVGNDDAFGAGVKVGWTGKITDDLTLGAVASSKIYMQEFDKYKGLFADNGDFDIPASFGLGLSYQISDSTAVALDVTRILYSDVDSIANPGPTAAEFFGALTSVLTTGGYAGAGALGGSDGWGFGWDDITVVKLGISHQYNKDWTFRAGINHGENPISDKENLFNIIAPGVVETHLTLGATYALDDYSELSFGYMRALREDQSYAYSADLGAPFGVLGYTAEIGMDQHALEISYGMKF